MTTLDYDLGSARFRKAIDEIDKSIYLLQKTKEVLLGTDQKLHPASDKAQDVTIKRLTRGNPTMAAKSADVRSHGPSDGGSAPRFGGTCRPARRALAIKVCRDQQQQRRQRPLREALVSIASCAASMSHPR